MTDGVEIHMSDTVDADAILGPDPNAKGPVDVYVQVYETPRGRHTFRVVDRFGEVVSPVRRDRFDTVGEARSAARAAVKEFDGVAQFEATPGVSGGPRLPEDEGDEE